MRKFIVWIVPFVSGIAGMIIMNAPGTLAARLILVLLLGFVSAQVFDMALRAYMIRTIEETTWSIKIEDEEV